MNASWIFSRLSTRRSLMACIALVAIVLPALAVARVAFDAGALERFRSLTTEERTRLRENYEDFKSLSTAEQESLRRRAKNLKRLGDEALESLPKDVSAKLEQLPPLKRREVQRDLMWMEARERGARARAIMERMSGSDWQNEQSAAEYSRLIKGFKLRYLDRILAETTKSYAETLNLGPEALAEALELPREERVRQLFAWTAELSKEELDRTGLPFGLSTEQWLSWRELPPEEFFREVASYREQLYAANDQRRWERLREAGLDPLADIPAERIQGLRELLAAARYRPAREIVELASLPRKERRKRVKLVRRELLQETMRVHALLPAEELNELPYLPENEIHSIVRRLLQPLVHSKRPKRPKRPEGK